jgi:hypothetical protein
LCQLNTYFFLKKIIYVYIYIVSNSSIISEFSYSILNNRARFENLAWRSWYRQYRQQKTIFSTIIEPEKVKANKTNNACITITNQKFYVVDDDDEEELVDDVEDDDDDDSWYIRDESEAEDDDELLFEKRRDNSSNNSIYHISSSQQQQPVSLLTQMLQEKNNKQKVPQITQQSQQLLRRCQSKYKSLNKWFTSS